MSWVEKQENIFWKKISSKSVRESLKEGKNLFHQRTNISLFVLRSDRMCAGEMLQARALSDIEHGHNAVETKK